MKKLLCAFLLVLMLTSRGPSTPWMRIACNPRMFEALGEKQKSLVEHGELRLGMTRDAVSLAWGQPSKVFQGSKCGKPTERRDDEGSHPVYSSNLYGSCGYGPYRHHLHPAYGFGMGPDVAYVPVPDCPGLIFEQPRRVVGED